MTCHKRIGIALGGLGEAGHSAKHPQTLKIRLASGQQLMNIRLMADIEDQTVNIRIKYGFNGHTELHHAQIRGEVSAGRGHMGHNKFPNLITKRDPLRVRKSNEICVPMDVL